MKLQHGVKGNARNQKPWNKNEACFIGITTSMNKVEERISLGLERLLKSIPPT